MPKEFEDPRYLDFLYKNTGGQRGKALPVIPEKKEPIERKKYEAPNNRLAKFLYAFGGGDPSVIDRMAYQQEEAQALNDPSSNRSAIARSLLQKLGGPVHDQLSAADVNEYLPSFEKLALLREKMNAKGGPKEKKYTESQSKYGLHAGSLENALYNLDKLNKKGYDPSTLWQSIQGSEHFPEYLKSEDKKLFDQAATDLGMAATFIKSGAAAPAQESRAIGATYADRPGDTPAVKEQKRIDRNLFLNQVNAASGGMGEEIINRNREIRDQLENQTPQNSSMGTGDVTSEKWILPNGQERIVSPLSPKYKTFIEEAKRAGAKRVQ